MTPLPFLRLITDPAPNPGRWNMAVDEALLQSAIDQDLATLRWYQWETPTVSLGHFQREGEIEREPRLAVLPRVRRLSGGGTLVHDQELTYSLALPASQRLIERPVDLYRLVHQAFIDTLVPRGVPVEFRGTTVRQAAEPLLCFSRQDENDLVLHGHKVLGSAQRRRRGAILQHGGLLLKASEVTPELPGLADLCPEILLNQFQETLTRILSERLALQVEESPLTVAELDLTARLAEIPA